MKNKLLFFIFLVQLFFIQSCYRISPSQGGGQLAKLPEERKIDPEDIILPKGYQAEVIAKGLTFPTGITFDEQETPFVVEAGYSYGEVFIEPKLLQVESDGNHELIYSGNKNGPWNGVKYYEGHFYIAEGGQLQGGRILKINKSGTIEEVLVDSLPSLGDHHTNGPEIHNGYVYFGQGTATNSSVVGLDNAKFGWLYRYPDFHDTPCRDIMVKEKNFKSKNVITDDPDDEAITGPFSAFNKPVQNSQIIKGKIPCNGAIMRVPVDGGELELAGWGFRNPYGLAVAPNGNLYITENAYDVRGSRPVWGTGDLLWRLEEGLWYGWPDFNGGIPVSEFNVPGDKDPMPVLAEYPNEPPRPVARLGVHSSSNGIDFSINNSFGYVGQAFIAQFGDMAPNVGKVMDPVGFKVVRVDIETGIVEDFAVNKVPKNKPASLLKSGGLERPVSVQFNPSGDALYIVDFGILLTGKETIPLKKTGVIWKISKKP